MTKWVVSGARRRVGKTFLAKRLAAILPNSVYAKLGRSAPNPKKSANYFTSEEDFAAFIKRSEKSCEHMVLETNVTLPSYRDAVRIYLDAKAGDGELRSDSAKLKELADIHIGRKCSPEKWRKVLSDKLDDEALRNGILGILADQKRMFNEGGISVRSKIWFVSERGGHAFGSGLATLLEEVEHLGSLNAAAEKSKMSYRHAWGEIREAEKNLGIKLTAPRTGGVGGGGSSLTIEGKRVLAHFRHLSERVAGFADEEFINTYDGRVTNE